MASPRTNGFPARVACDSPASHQVDVYLLE